MHDLHRLAMFSAGRYSNTAHGILYAMRKLMVIQHIDCEPLGLFAEEAAGLAEFTYVRPFKGEPVPDSLAGWDGLIILGGPMAVHESDESLYLNDELNLIAGAIKDDFPCWESACSQLIALHGARVIRAPREAGWGEVVLTEAAGKTPVRRAAFATAGVPAAWRHFRPAHAPRGWPQTICMPTRHSD